MSSDTFVGTSAEVINPESFVRSEVFVGSSVLSALSATVSESAETVVLSAFVLDRSLTLFWRPSTAFSTAVKLALSSDESLALETEPSGTSVRYPTSLEN